MEIVFQLIGIVICGYMAIVAIQIAVIIIGLIVFTCIGTYKKIILDFFPKRA